MLKFLEPKQAKYTGKIAETVDFVTEMQLKDKKLWKQFAEQYRLRPDGKDKGWRGEFWGKMMRGGCLIYSYSGDEELYSALEYAVCALLETQDEKGRFSTYTVDLEFCGWDMWCRKYVLTGLQHFYRICNDSALKNKILTAMRLHADYICERIGEGKLDIRKTSHIYGGVNSCSILEPFVELYKLSQDKKYLDFAEYILATGGCADGSLFECVENRVLPYQYPTRKAYETMSFFEGVLAYYEVTGNEKYFSLVERFVEDVYETDVTVIGCSGCAHELFDNSSNSQTAQVDWLMQETCVTVTWMRLLFRLHLLTGDAKYVERIERAGVNAMWGSLNTEKQLQYSTEKKVWLSPLPFDSYSPLVYNKRGRGIGGFREFEEGGFYGCCACIGSAGVAIMPLVAVLQADDGVIINSYSSGTVTAKTPNGNNVCFVFECDPLKGKTKLTVKCSEEERFTIKLRKPEWSRNFALSSKEIQEEKDGYIAITDVWKEQTLTVDLDVSLRKEIRNGKTAFLYGDIVLALDNAKNTYDFEQELDFLVGEILPHEKGEQIRYQMTTIDGKKYIFTDYASCGKGWENENSKVSVWLNVK
ncbi:MAG: glycoside hydrolase family 127 protein [Clostridia bacterium]|nr:glycoside hydrolase family 127 protein [Clostridia bacterium]